MLLPNILHNSAGEHWYTEDEPGATTSMRCGSRLAKAQAFRMTQSIQGRLPRDGNHNN